MTTGASPISGEVLDFLRICFGSEVIEGYGMTETSCTISMTSPTDLKAGHVGGPLPSCEVKLADIPEMSYTTADQPHPRGEVQSAQQRLNGGRIRGVVGCLWGTRQMQQRELLHCVHGCHFYSQMSACCPRLLCAACRSACVGQLYSRATTRTRRRHVRCWMRMVGCILVMLACGYQAAASRSLTARRTYSSLRRCGGLFLLILCLDYSPSRIWLTQTPRSTLPLREQTTLFAANTLVDSVAGRVHCA